MGHVYGPVVIAAIIGATLGTATPAIQQPPGTDRATPPVETIKDIMKRLDPPANRVWSAVWADESAASRIQRQPRSVEEWRALEDDARALAEAAALLKTPARPVASPDEMHRKTTRDPRELTPAQAAERIARSRYTFQSLADRLDAASRKAQDAARARSPRALLEAGKEINTACVACHETYWHPDGPFSIPPPIR
jgi:hypothetical protein